MKHKNRLCEGGFAGRRRLTAESGLLAVAEVS
jgi:hypothetical protein